MQTLISFAGLPGVGKTTVARQLAQQQGIPYLRVDEIEGVLMVDDPERDIGPLGYQIAAALAVSNLSLGQNAIIDCVNPWQLTRDIFKDAARTAESGFFGVELYCSDETEHRLRVETRHADIPGKDLPDWQKVMARDYHPWAGADLRVDTAKLSAGNATDEIIRALGQITKAERTA
ncbi:AAA family ATPase [Nisaea nitritireducens]|uniref:AAA family ATPase n=1 Tax=Nisaea nitritireducens TaxID=568392 RepID=UPI00186837EA|nr:AAA family ATPase [Nisaea nitritireducens]